MVVVACGTSWHAGLAGRHMIEALAKVPVQVELASEFRNREPLVSGRVLLLAISQSGETADTLAAVKVAKARGAKAMAICNVVGSAIPRECDLGTLFTRAGPEIGVASTKAFTTQLAALFLLGLRLGRLRGFLSVDEARRHIEALERVPAWMEQMIRQELRILHPLVSEKIFRRLRQRGAVSGIAQNPQNSRSAGVHE